MTRHVTRMTIYDALHYGAAQRAAIIDTYPKHVRGARAMGQPSVGEGAVYAIDDDAILCDPFDIPPWWYELGGLDFGWDHPTAAVNLVRDPDQDIFYVTQEYRRRQLVPIMHVNNLKQWGPELRFAWGLEGLQTKLSENPEQTQKLFRKHGLKMLDSHATFHNGGVGVERGVTEILELMMAGRFKVFRTCRMVIEEKSTYHRKRKSDQGVAQIVKVNDDLMDAMRYAYMMFRSATPVSWRKKWGGRPNAARAGRPAADGRDIFNGR
jgi:hypothetical protein